VDDPARTECRSSEDKTLVVQMHSGRHAQAFGNRRNLQGKSVRGMMKAQWRRHSRAAFAVNAMRQGTPFCADRRLQNAFKPLAALKTIKVLRIPKMNSAAVILSFPAFG
jgi:hypothetical protein